VRGRTPSSPKDERTWALQLALDGAQDGELVVAGAAAAEVVEAEVNDGDAAESLALHVLGLDGRRVGVLVAHPHPVLAAVVGGTVGVAAEPLGGIAHLAQRSVGALQVLVGRVGQLGAHLRPAEESGDLGLCASRSQTL